MLGDDIVAVHDAHVGAVVLGRHSIHRQVRADNVFHILSANIFMLEPHTSVYKGNDDGIW